MILSFHSSFEGGIRVQQINASVHKTPSPVELASTWTHCLPATFSSNRDRILSSATTLLITCVCSSSQPQHHATYKSMADTLCILCAPISSHSPNAISLPTSLNPAPIQGPLLHMATAVPAGRCGRGGGAQGGAVPRWYAETST